MFRLSNKHPIFNRTVLWPIALGSVAIVVPLALAKSLPSRPQSATSSSAPAQISEPSPLNQSSPQQPQDKLSAERDWHLRQVSQSWSQHPTPNTAKTAIASGKTQSSASKAIASNSAASKADTPHSKSTVAKANTSQSHKSTSQTHASASSKTRNQQRSNYQNSTTANQEPARHHSKNAPVLEMRVAIANGASSLVVGSSTPAQVLDGRGRVLGKLPANQGTNVLPDGSNIQLGQWQAPAGVWIKPTQGGFVFVGDRWYRGDLLLVTQGNSLLAVNYVELESYIASVVGAEVSPSWPIDALKAQAIAARSYALVHYIRPASSLYDLGNTERWQVYRGIDAEWNTTRQAAKETSGVFLSYKGGVVESMYAASDDIVTNIFGGRGMSQNGALTLATQGYNYKQILGNYYPGTGLAWLDTKESDAD